MADALFVVDGGGCIRDLNDTALRLLGYERGDLLGDACTLVCVDTTVLRSIRQAVDSGERNVFETQLRHRSGRLIPVSVSGTLLPSVDGEPPGIICVASDITERTSMETQLAAALEAAEDSSRAKAEFLANMSHELRTPLNGVIGMTRLLRQTRLSTEQAEMAGAIDVSANALLDVVNDILDFSKIEAGYLRLERIPFDPRETLYELLDIHRIRAHEKGVQLTAMASDSVPCNVSGDVGRIRQVLNNLVSNAVKFTGEGEVSLSLTCVEQSDDSATLRFEVRDTGIGISEAARTTLFHPFAQGDVSTYRRYGGTGLGLVISRQLVESMSGTLGFSSEPGKGSTFWFEVPLELVETDHSEASPVLADVSVLVVAPAGTARDQLARLLERAGARTESVETAREALQLLRDADGAGREFKLGIVDAESAGDDPSAFARRIRSLLLVTHPSLLLLTNVVDAARDGAPAGFAATVTRPPNARRLYDTAVAVLEGKRVSTTMLGYPEGVVPRNDVRVLVADDNAINQKVLLGQLSALGIPGHAVANGLEVLDALERIDYSLLLLDLYMPELDGYATAAKIRADSRYDDLPIVAVTASATPAERERCMSVGMNDFVGKPVDLVVLETALARWLDGRALSGSYAPLAAASGVGSTSTSDGLDESGLDLSVLERLVALEQLSGEPGLVAGLIESFLAQTPPRLADLGAAIARGEHETVRTSAHALKGVCLNVGARAMADVAALLEASPDGPAARATARRLEASFHAAAAALQQRLGSFQPAPT